MKNKISPDEFDIRYSNWVSQLIDIIKPTDLFVVGGRGLAKTTDILAKRSIDVVYDMPRATFMVVSDTYVNLLGNIIPELRTGWERQKFFERVGNFPGHFVVDKEPPTDWPRPYTPATEFKHTIHTFNGCKFLLKSLDRPSMGAGVSVQHMFGDETKFLKLIKLKKFTPTLRGDIVKFGKSHYFMGRTFLTDMPNASEDEDPWILDMKKEMDVDQIIKIYYTSIVCNEIEFELYKARNNKASNNVIENIQRKLHRWQIRLNYIRTHTLFEGKLIAKPSCLFFVASTLANIDVLSFEYLLKHITNYEEFKTAFLSIFAGISKDQRFYGNFSDKHIYSDGYNYDYYDQFGLNDNITQTSQGLKYIRPNQLLEGGFDMGNMMSLVIGQEQGKTFRCLKDMYVLTPEWLRDLGNQFVEFFKPHKYKVLELYYDRAANNYAKAKKDNATELKNAIEKDSAGASTGWQVRLMSIGQKNITHLEEFGFMNQLMSGSNRGLPELQIDKHECKELISSIKLAPVVKDSKGAIKKIKKSEKLPLSRLPMESTNMSDAFKYLMCRKKYLNIVKSRNSVGFGDSTIR